MKALLFVSVFALVFCISQVHAEKVLTLDFDSGSVKTLDPQRVTKAVEHHVVSQACEAPLDFEYGVEGPGLIPVLLTQLPETTDNLVWTLTLKDNIYFHNDPVFPNGIGRKVVAKDLVYSWLRLADKDAGLIDNDHVLRGLILGWDDIVNEFKERPSFNYDAPVKGIEILNDHQIKITLTEPAARFRYALAQQQLAVVAREAVEKYGIAQFGMRPICTGPFVFSFPKGKWAQGNEPIVLLKNEKYHQKRSEVVWSGQKTLSDEEKNTLARFNQELYVPRDLDSPLPLLDKVVFHNFGQGHTSWLDFNKAGTNSPDIIVPDFSYMEHFASRFRGGENFSKKFGVNAEARAKGYRTAIIPALAQAYIGINMNNSDIGHPAGEKGKLVRQALSLAIDFEDRNSTFYHGTQTIFDGPIPPGLPGHPKNGELSEAFRGPKLSESRRLLESAGYPNAQGLPELNFYIAVSGPLGMELSDHLRRQLGQVGFRVNPKQVDFSTLTEKISNGDDVDLFLSAWFLDYPDAIDAFTVFYGKNAPPMGSANVCKYRNLEFDKLFEEVQNMEAGDERTAKLERMRDIIVEDVPAIGFFRNVTIYLMKGRVHNFNPGNQFSYRMKYVDVGSAANSK